MVSVSADPAGGWQREWVEKKELMMLDKWVVVEAINHNGLQGIERRIFVVVQRVFWLVSYGYGDGMVVLWVGL